MSSVKIVTSDGVRITGSDTQAALVSETNSAVLVSSEQGPRGVKGDQGEQGPPGPQGPEGPETGDVLDLSLIFENQLL